MAAPAIGPDGGGYVRTWEDRVLPIAWSEVPEQLQGKQVCPNAKCQYWGGNRDEQAEKAKAAESAAAKQVAVGAELPHPSDAKDEL